MAKANAPQARAQPDYPRGVTFEQVWAGLMENREQLKETDRIVKDVAKRQEETALQMKETGRRIDEYNKRFGDFTRRFGEVVEYMIAPNLLEKFREAGLCFAEAGPNRMFTNTEHDISFEVDVMLEDDDKAMLVEVKTKLTTEDVKEHIKRLGKMRTYANLRGDTRMFFGAVAGVIITPYAKKYALGQGFFVIEPSGETFNITPPQGKPKEW